MIIPWPPGGGTDVIGRIICQRLAEQVGQQIVVDNRGGASTIIGTEILVKSAPDGHTLGFATSNLATNPSLYARLPYDAAKDLAPVTLAVQGLYVIVAHPSLPVKSVKESIVFVKTAGAKFNVALAGPGTPNHLGLAQFNDHARRQCPRHPVQRRRPRGHRVGGRRDAARCSSAPDRRALRPGGTLRLLAVTSAERSAALPELPTAVEAGLPGFVLTEWLTAFLRLRETAARVTHSGRGLRTPLSHAETKQRLIALGAEVVASTPEEFAAYIRGETSKWAKVIKAAGIKAE